MVDNRAPSRSRAPSSSFSVAFAVASRSSPNWQRLAPRHPPCARHRPRSPRARFGQPAAHAVLQAVEALQQAGWKARARCPGWRFNGGAYLHLAALELGRQHFAQCRLMLTQLVRQTERQVQKAAVDRANFQSQTARCGAWRPVPGWRARRFFGRSRSRSCCKLHWIVVENR